MCRHIAIANWGYRLYSYGPFSYDLYCCSIYGHNLNSYGLDSYGPRGYGLYSYGSSDSVTVACIASYSSHTVAPLLVFAVRHLTLASRIISACQ